MSNFSFFYSVFKRLLLQTRKNQGLFGKGLKRKINSENRAIQAEKGLHLNKLKDSVLSMNGVLWPVDNLGHIGLRLSKKVTI